MVTVRLLVAAMLALLGPVSLHAQGAQDSRAVELALPRAASPREGVYLAVRVGVIVRGTEIEITTSSGAQIGTVSPFAIRPGQPAGTYVFPLDPTMIRNGRITVHLKLTRAGIPARSPSPDEVAKVSILFMPIAKPE